jgi:phosphotransferase family enzyme
VLEVAPGALVLAKVKGPTMWEAAGAEASSAAAHAVVLAQLHRDLHEIEAPEGLPAVGDGARLRHLDLHPANVILSPEGPVVIDWTNARRGEPAFDVALTWVIAATTTGLGRVAGSFLQHFLALFDRDELRRVLRAAGEYRVADPNVTDEERQAVRQLLLDEEGP